MATRKFEPGYLKLKKKELNFLLNHKKGLWINL